jgi:hypothetical protein
MFRRGNTFCASIVILHSANVIQNELDKINKDSVVNPFFRDTYQVKDKYRYSNAIELVKSVNCNITCIDETSVMEPSKLLIPYFGVDIEEIIKNIIIASKIDPANNRDKYLLATVRGVGGGKSRMVEETRIRMGILLPNWLPIAITFNHYTGNSPSDYQWKDGQMIIAYAICTRIIASVYSLTLDEAQKRMDLVIAAVEEAYTGSKTIQAKMKAKDVIVGTMRHIARRVKKDKPSIDSFVLFVDESMRLIEDAQFPTCSDPYDLLRQTILGQEVGQELKSSLLMTSLAVSALGATDSNRRIKPVVLASKLPVVRIVEDIWISSFNSTSNDAASTAELSLLAATVNSAPRLVEMMGMALSSEFQNTWPNSSSGKGLKDSMKAVLSMYYDLQADYYPKMAFPVGKYLYALVNGQPIAVDNTVLKYVRKSAFTNSITSFHVANDATDKNSIVPESSLSLLARAESDKLPDNTYEKKIKEEFEAVWNDLKTHILSEKSGTAKGQVLEDILPRVLRMRLLSAHLKRKKRGQTTLMELLAVNIDSIMFTVGGRPYNAANTSSNYSFKQDGVVRSAEEWMEKTFERASASSMSTNKFLNLKKILNRPIIVSEIFELLQIASSVNNPVDRRPWKNNIKSIFSSLDMRKMFPGNDHCDLMLFLRKLQGPAVPATYSDDEIVLPMECKSMDEVTKTALWQGHCWSKGSRPYRQYALFCEAVDSITEADLVGDNGYLRALKEGRFLYVYMTTLPGPSVYLTAEDLIGITTKMTKSLGVLVLNRDLAQKILGYTNFDLYAMTRSMMQ